MIKAKAFSKEEIKKASNTFATFKDKIANFFETSKQVETKINEMKENASSGLQLLMSNYGTRATYQMFGSGAFICGVMYFIAHKFYLSKMEKLRLRRKSGKLSF